MRKYVDDSNLQIAMTEYNDNSINREVNDQYDRSVGTVTQSTTILAMSLFHQE